MSTCAKLLKLFFTCGDLLSTPVATTVCHNSPKGSNEGVFKQFAENA